MSGLVAKNPIGPLVVPFLSFGALRGLGGFFRLGFRFLLFFLGGFGGGLFFRQLPPMFFRRLPFAFFSFQPFFLGGDLGGPVPRR